MDSFVFYHALRSVKDILLPYSSAEEIRNEINDTLEQLTTGEYRVAVIGEFKRGKSSLINALLGTEILPTDILPATAVVNKIVYNTEQKIEINYLNGKHEETSIENLKDFSTKLDEKKAATVREIKEIVVHYPSIIGQENIVLYDTPGLNDDELMTKKTIEILDEIDTAIVVISATMPLSMTEKKLICTLLEKQDIYHIIFVASFIDRVSEEDDEQDRIIDLITERISIDTFDMFLEKHSEDKALVEKAERILKNPDVFAVSAKQAMQGFIKDDRTLINKSRFPSFKLKIVSLLTAKQNLFIADKAHRLIENVNSKFDKSANDEISKISDEIEIELEKVKQLKSVSAERNLKVKNCLFKEMNDTLVKNDFSDKVGNIRYYLREIGPYKIFVDELKKIKSDNYNAQSVITALETATDLLNIRCHETVEKLEKIIMDEIDKTEKVISEFDEVMNLTATSEKWCENHSFPELQFSCDDFFKHIPNLLCNIMPIISSYCNVAFQKYQHQVSAYINDWRLFCCDYEAQQNEEIVTKADEINSLIADLEFKKSEFIKQINISKNELNNILSEIKER